MRYVEFMETKGGRELAMFALERATEIFLKVYFLTLGTCILYFIFMIIIYCCNEYCVSSYEESLLFTFQLSVLALLICKHEKPSRIVN